MPSKRINHGGPEFELSECGPDEARAEGTILDTGEFDGDSVQAGHIYFHPGTRAPPLPPAADVQAFVAAHPELPLVFETDRVVEVPHLVLARFVCKSGGCDMDGDDEVAVDEDGCPLILLYTVAADNSGRCFPPSTHVKNGKQHDGVKIFDWSAVNFDASLGRTPREAWLALYRALWSL